MLLIIANTRLIIVNGTGKQLGVAGMWSYATVNSFGEFCIIAVLLDCNGSGSAAKKFP
mgnify:FL=1